MSKTSSNSFKVVLVGESGVGKTSIINQFVDLEFLENRSTTTGASFSSKTMKINSKSLSFEVWDTAGQERFRSLTKLFYKDTNAALIVYDITNEETFSEAENYWVLQINEFAPPNVIKVLVANKNDLIDKEVVTEDIGMKLAAKIGAIFSSTSAKNKYGIDAMFMAIGHKHLDPNWIDNEESGVNAQQPQAQAQTSSNDKGAQRLGKPISVNSNKKSGCC